MRSVNLPRMVRTIFEWIGIITVASTVAFGVLRYLAKKLLENYLSRQMESYKSELQRLNISHQIQFASLHKERAEIIKQLYHLLHDYRLAVIVFFNQELNKEHPVENLKHNLAKWTGAVLAFSNTFHENRIYFSEEVVDQINKFNNKMEEINKSTQEFLGSFQYAQEQVNAIKEKHPRFVEFREKSMKLLEKEVLPIEADLENEFRHILGVEISKRK